MTGNLGEAVIKTSAVDAERHVIEAPCMVFDNEDNVKAAFQAGELNRDVVVVVRGQGPRANGMPELHGLTPSLTILQDQGYRVALVTDGRMSGASGRVPAAIHVSPEAKDGGPLSRIETGDVIRLDATIVAKDMYSAVGSNANMQLCRAATVADIALRFPAFAEARIMSTQEVG